MTTPEQRITKETITAFFADLQDRICRALEEADGTGVFHEDAWERPGGGGGRSRTLVDGPLIEKGGVGYSVVHGEATEATLRSLSLTEPAEFYATGVSIVLHPRNPMIPIIHMNVRYFEMSTGHNWFGGGIDLLSSTLTTYEALSKVSLLALESAVRVLQLVIARDSALVQGVESAFSEDEIQVLQVLGPELEGNTEKLKNPYKASDLKFGLWVIARLGGWSGYEKQTPPGPITLHRGLVKFKQMVEGFKLAQSTYQGTG